ncbi:hypothetical protein MRB53_040713 [Persea americana]|nr:hypothetical protein MRB53_040713 [Persea americana]
MLSNQTNYTLLGAGTDGVFNRIGRAYPDVAALAENIVSVSFGRVNLVLALRLRRHCGPVSSLESTRKRLRIGKRPAGFLNPTLYKYPEMFNDITQGYNPNCGGIGFDATKGWDPVTGLAAARICNNKLHVDCGIDPEIRVLVDHGTTGRSGKDKIESLPLLQSPQMRFRLRQMVKSMYKVLKSASSASWF